MSKVNILNSKLQFALFIALSVLFVTPAYPLDNAKLVSLSKRIIEVKDSGELISAFNELTGLYFSENKYNECAEFLKSLISQKQSLAPEADYYIALTRYNQLRHLEETQSWDEYFSQGNNYRDEIVQDLGKATAAIPPDNALSLQANLLLWKFHKDQNDSFVEDTLVNLMNVTSGYAKDSKNIIPVKEVADQLLSYGEKSKSRELYKIYVNKLVASEIKDDELYSTALGFYQQGNMELAETIFDVYIERISKSYPKEKLIAALTEIAKMFAYKQEGFKDPSYAEKIFQKIEEVGGGEAFNEELIYLRAINLEKSKEYKAAMEVYHILIERFPKTSHFDEAVFKIGTIHTYILHDINTGKSYFEKLASQQTITPQVISSLYQLGILSQWGGNLSAAKEYYNKLIDKAGTKQAEIVASAKARLKEIEDGKPMDFALKSFLDASLKQENSYLDMSKLELNSSTSTAGKDSSLTLTAAPSLGQSGCMSVALQFFWSGDLGKASPSVSSSSLEISFSDEGTKIVGLVASSATGIVDRSLTIIDVR